jgi:hypothetical protein
MRNDNLTVREATREVSVRQAVDVAVCGGGPAGIAAAVAAAEQGMRTALVESYGFLGGINTAAGVNGIGGWQHDLDGRPLVGGLGRRLMEELAVSGGARPDQVTRVFQARDSRPTYREGGLGCYWINSSPDYVKLLLDRWMERHGISVLYHANAVMPILDGQRVKGVYVESKSGRQAISAKVVIDCTGDGDIAARAGCQFDMGRPEDGLCQPMSIIYTVGNADVPELNYVEGADESHLDELERNRYSKAIELARARRELALNPNELFCAATPVNLANPLVRSVNFTRVQGKDATNADAMTQAEIEGRRQVMEGLQFMRSYVRNCKDAYLISILPQIGIRESRRIRGQYILTGEDVMKGASFHDSIARGIYMLDIHNPSSIQKSTLKLLDQPYDIPYRSLVPLGVEGLLTAGRCISGDHVAHASYRIISHCYAMGEAAGTAAAMAVDGGVSPERIDTDILQRTLEARGANTGRQNHK